MEGWDHKVSADLDDMKNIVINAGRIHASLGSNRISRVENEERLGSFRRSIVAAKEIKKGEIFLEDMIDFKRPGTGLPPEAVEYLVGKAAKRDIKSDEIIAFEDF